MSKAIYYQIDGNNEEFKTLRDAKYHIWVAYTPNERIKYFGKEPSYICGIDRNEEVVSITEIKIDDSGKESFGRTMKY